MRSSQKYFKFKHVVLAIKAATSALMFGVNSLYFWQHKRSEDEALKNPENFRRFKKDIKEISKMPCVTVVFRNI